MKKTLLLALIASLPLTWNADALAQFHEMGW